MSKFIQIAASQSESEEDRDLTIYALDDSGAVWIYIDQNAVAPDHWKKLSTKRGRVEKGKFVEEPQ